MNSAPPDQGVTTPPTRDCNTCDDYGLIDGLELCPACGDPSPCANRRMIDGWYDEDGAR